MSHKCPPIKAGVLVSSIAERIVADGGALLVADYGHCGEKGDTLRAFRGHALQDPLKEPGDADLTADVDFSYLIRSVGEESFQFLVFSDQGKSPFSQVG